VFVLGTAFDITARKLAEEALRNSEEKFRTLVDTTPAATVIFQGTKVLYANRMVFDVLGYSPEDLATLNFWDAVHPDYRDLARERGNARLRGEDVPSSYEVRFLTKSGEPRWGIYSAALITYEGKPAVIGTVFDITERKQAEEAHHQSEERYRILYQDNPSMYFTLAEDLSVLSVNQHGADQLGYTPEELVGEPVLLVVHADDQTHVRRQLESLLRHRGVRHGLEFRKVRKDGEVIWVKESVRVTHDVDGKRIILVVCEDISERKRMEEALQGLREELEHKAERAIAGDNPYNLSFRELTVLHLVTGGRSDKEIGAVLGIRPQTVSKHVANVLKKMQASSRTEAGVRALREGLVA
jgi:PAS domain S-box-containing protein